MNKLLLIIFILSFFKCQNDKATEQSTVFLEKKDSIMIPLGIRKILKAYPDFFISADTNSLIWYDSSIMLFDDFKVKNFDEMINAPDIEDQFKMKYLCGNYYEIPVKNYDPGRIRFEPFFRKMYGNSKKEVQDSLVNIHWLPSSINQTLSVTKINGIDKKIQAISNELDTLKHLIKYLDNPGGTYYWRKIKGTTRLSMHSFGIAIDINVNYSNYWKWSNIIENDSIPYKNRIPMEIVIIFEKHGFIWGGKWYHHDTMHFEYRPELIEL